MACSLPNLQQCLTSCSRHRKTYSRPISARLPCQPSIQCRQQLIVQSEQRLYDIGPTLRCNASGGPAPPGVPSSSEEFQQLDFPGTLRQAWRLLLEVLWAKGHFTDEYGDKDDAFEDITEVKRAVLDAARQRADIIFMLPKDSLTKLAQVPLPVTPRSDERKLRNAYKRLVDTYRPGSTAAAQQPTASVQDVLRVIWSWEDAISSPRPLELEHAAAVEPVAVQLLHDVLLGLFSSPDAAHQAAADKLGTITASQVKQLQQYQAARQAGAPAHPAGKQTRPWDARPNRQGIRFDGRVDAPSRPTDREGRWQSYGNAAQQQQQQRADRRPSDGQQAWYSDSDGSLQVARKPTRQTNTQASDHKGAGSPGADTNQLSFQVERYGQDGQRDRQQTTTYGRSSGSFHSNRAAGEQEEQRRSQTSKRTRQRPWQSREESTGTSNSQSAAGQYARRSWVGEQQLTRHSQVQAALKQSSSQKQEDRVRRNKQRERGTSPSSDTGESDVREEPGWKDLWQE